MCFSVCAIRLKFRKIGDRFLRFRNVVLEKMCSSVIIWLLKDTKTTMEKKFSQIHIIPFDIGLAFVDVLAVDNTKNLLFAQKFIQTLSERVNAPGTGIEVYDNLEITYSDKTIIKYSFKNKEIAEDTICYARLKENLYCYILTSGVAVFVLADIGGRAIDPVRAELSAYSPALMANYQKKISQSAILNKFDGILTSEKKLMLEFRKLCWSVVGEISRKIKTHLVRKFSSNLNYKAKGLSYVLTIYVFDKGDLSERELECLMFSSVFGRVADKKNWPIINEHILSSEVEVNEADIETVGKSKVYFSWTGVAVVCNDDIRGFECIAESEVLNALVKAEIYVQSRWFVADNSMDNVNKSMKLSMESLQRIESLMEFSQAELDNEISANMNTMYKNVLEKIIRTSQVRNLYGSVVNQIHTQRKIREAHYQDRHRKNRFVANLFLAVFTASSLFQAILDIIENTSTVRTVLIFVAALIVAIGMVIFDYKNK